ncbi:DoxX family protein [Mitsuaria sp. GD03876]|uniref:DoxX family protein n=1 Tax=Mitsuaria sp. GD03876 TaxID=2975399 RepID=UPI00244BD997|nr:DoxX family protein [Mitsuaria sp. GD03876]MDH0866895.1 DoxX family protein [Mitsuaria sp. GD03876]
MNTITPTTSSSASAGAPSSLTTAPSLLAAIRDRLERWISPDLIALACRFSIAGVFWLSGRTKVEGWFTLTDTTFLLFRQDYALPLIPPEWAAYLATTAEHVLPILLALGLGTRLAAAGVLGMTAVIQTFVYPSGWPTHLSWAAPMLYLLGRGPGRWSLDHVLFRGSVRHP